MTCRTRAAPFPKSRRLYKCSLISALAHGIEIEQQQYHVVQLGTRWVRSTHAFLSQASRTVHGIGAWHRCTVLVG